METRFVSSFAQQYLSVPNQLQMALIRYSDSSQLAFNFNSHSSLQGVVQTVSSFQYRGGGNTNTGAALRMARRRIFVQSSGVRPSSSSTRLCVLVTDGQSNIGPDVRTEADTLRQLGVRIVAVGIGSSTNQQELESIASLPSSANVFQLESFNGFMSILADINRAACEGGYKRNERKSAITQTRY